MDKQLFEPLSGFRDYNKPTKAWVSSVLRQTFQQYGYQALETPALERQEILLGKLGEEGQKQLYLFEDNGKRQVGLRYDLTVPLARFVAGNFGSLSWPFKRYEIGPVWRAEKPQKGRYRQFTQADIDIVNAPEPSSELELLSVATVVCEQLGVKLQFQLNDRRVIAELFDALKIPTDQRQPLLQLLDKKEKMTEEVFADALNDLKLTDVERRQVNRLFFGSDRNKLEPINELIGESGATNTIEAMLAWAKSRGIEAVFAPAMVRGLEYYTGTIFELIAPEYDGGTVAAGGRYDSLIESLIGQKIPAVGISFGVDRLADLLEGKEKNETIFVVRLPEATELNNWVRELRQNGRKVEVYLDENVELGKQIKYADKRGYQEIYIPFIDEWKKGEIVVKNLKSGDQKAVKRETLNG